MIMKCVITLSLFFLSGCLVGLLVGWKLCEYRVRSQARLFLKKATPTRKFDGQLNVYCPNCGAKTDKRHAQKPFLKCWNCKAAI